MGTYSNLSELTVTCRQCGSASMERLGPREYRCNHCGAITVVSQDQQAQAAAYQSSRPAAGSADDIRRVYPGPPVASTARPSAGAQVGKLSPRGWFFLIFVGLVLAASFYGTHFNHESAKDETKTAPPAVPVPMSQLALSPPAWMTDPTSGVSSGRYVSMLYNHSPWPIQVPRYGMTLYTDGIRGATATSEASLARLMPGEYEPVSFAFETPNGSTLPEIAPPVQADRADAASVNLPLTEMQLVRQEGKPEYRLVGLVQNNTKAGVKSVQVLVMLFGTHRTLIGYGTGFGRAMRPGEQAAIDVHVTTANVEPVLRYEYLVDATAEDQ